MRIPLDLPRAVLLFSTVASTLAASWSFTDATVSVQGKGSGIGSGYKEKLAPNAALTKEVTFGPSDTLKIILTTQEEKSAKRPHQAFLTLKEASTGLDISYPFSVKESGKAKLDLTHKDIPAQFLRSPKGIDAIIVIASFGSSQGYNHKAFPLSLELDSTAAAATGDKPLRYGKLPVIHHIFKSDPKSPNILISVVFGAGVLATLPILLGTWLYLGGNVSHLSKAMQDAPLSHALFFGSILSIEGVFFLYYTTWRLFTALPVLLALGLVTWVSGSRALTEVQDRRLAGLR